MEYMSTNENKMDISSLSFCYFKIIQYIEEIIHHFFFNFSLQQNYFQLLLKLSENSIIRYPLVVHDIDLKRCTIELVHSINFEDGKNECTKTIAT